MKKIEIYKFWRLFAMAALVLFIFSCSKDDEIIDDPVPDDNEEQVVEETSQTFIYDKFKENYFWIDKVPVLDPTSYSSNEALIDALRYDEIDRWSFVSDLQEYRALFEQGETKGFGVAMSITSDNRLMVRFTYKKSPMGLAGVDRGWEFLKINDVSISEYQDLWGAFNTDSPVKFTFKTVEGNTVEHTMTRTDYEINTVLYKDILEAGGRNVGYLVFESFLGPSEQELNDAFDFFKVEGISDIIVDLRYNGGGSLGIAFQLSELVGGSEILNNVLTSIVHNANRSDENVSYGYYTEDASGHAVELDRLFFITTENSASASEMVINSMFPYKDVVLVGSKTHGKPVGMEVYESEKYQIALAPVTFQLVNADGYGDYFGGISVDYEEVDDIFHAWGDPEEACLKKVLQVINGEVDQLATKSALIKSNPMPLKRGLQEITGTY